MVTSLYNDVTSDGFYHWLPGRLLLPWWLQTRLVGCLYHVNIDLTFAWSHQCSDSVGFQIFQEHFCNKNVYREHGQYMNIFNYFFLPTMYLSCFRVQCQRVKNCQNCLNRAETRVFLIIFNSVLYHVHPCTVNSLLPSLNCMNQVSEKLYFRQWPHAWNITAMYPVNAFCAG